MMVRDVEPPFLILLHSLREFQSAFSNPRAILSHTHARALVKLNLN